MKRVLVVLAGLVLALCVGCVFLGYFVAIPRVKDGVRTGIDEAVSTYVAPQIAGIGIAPNPGTYTLSEDQVNQQIQSSGGANLQDLRFRISPSGLTFNFGEQGQQLAYTAQVSAVDGKLHVETADLTGIPTWIVPSTAISHGVEDGINGYLAEHNLRLTRVTLQDGSMTLVLDGATATPVS